MSFGALSDINVLDLTQMLAGPFGTMVLADHGAQVIKIEPPQGDMTRQAGAYPEDDRLKTHNGYFQSINRNKQSIVLDLKTEAGRAAFFKLVESADVVAENFKHGTMERLGLSYETLKEINPRLVYACLRGFGDARTGKTEYTDWPAFDVVAQAMGGIMAITGADGKTPTKIGPGVGDILPGVMMAFGILAAVHHARNSGQGQFVDVSMVDSVLSLSERIVYQYGIENKVPKPEGNHHPFISPFGIFAAKDGYVTIAAPQDKFFEFLCQHIDAKDLSEDERFSSMPARAQNRQALIPLIEDKIQHYTKAELKEKLGGHIPFGLVLQADEIFADEYFSKRDMLPEIDQPGSTQKVKVAGVPIKLSNTPGKVRMRAPHLGEHSRMILSANGFSEDDINALIEMGISSQFIMED